MIRLMEAKLWNIHRFFQAIAKKTMETKIVTKNNISSLIS